LAFEHGQLDPNAIEIRDAEGRQRRFDRLTAGHVAFDDAASDGRGQAQDAGRAVLAAAQGAHALFGGGEVGTRRHGLGLGQLRLAIGGDFGFGQFRFALFVGRSGFRVSAGSQHRGLGLAEVGALDLGQ